MRGSVGGTVDIFGQFESQIQQRSVFFLSGRQAAEPTDQPDVRSKVWALGAGVLATWYIFTRTLSIVYRCVAIVSVHGQLKSHVNLFF